MATRSEKIADHIAARIVRNTRKKWASLHADALEDLAMSDTNGVPSITVKQTDHNALEGSNKGADYRSQAAQPAPVPQPAPRAETEQAGS